MKAEILNISTVLLTPENSAEKIILNEWTKLGMRVHLGGATYDCDTQQDVAVQIVFRQADNSTSGRVPFVTTGSSLTDNASTTSV